jgi:hypothetical protein
MDYKGMLWQILLVNIIRADYARGPNLANSLKKKNTGLDLAYLYGLG